MADARPLFEISAQADAPAVAAASVLAAATLLVIRRQDSWGFYSTVDSFQLTIWSIHTMPPLVGRLLLGGPSPLLVSAAAAWVMLSWACRSWRTSPYSLFFVVLEASWALALPSPSVVSAMVGLQILIVVVVWAAILGAACTGAYSVAALDRHLRRGPAHWLKDPEALDQLGRELYGHCFLQVLSIVAVVLRTGGLPPLGNMATLGAFASYTGAYVLVAFLATSLLPPHQLPYELGRLPESWRLPWSKLAEARGRSE